jgi:hypothetical protein
MIKMVFCLKRRPDLTREQFQRYWREEHEPLVKRHAAGLGCGASDRPGKGRGLSRRGRTDRPLDPAATNLAASQPLQHAR